MKLVRDFILSAAGMILILSAAVIFTLACKPLYYYDVDALHISEVSGYEKEEILANYDALIEYNLDPLKETLVFPTFPMSAEGEIHFSDVKKIFQLFLIAMLISGSIFLVGLACRWPQRDYGYLRLTGLVTLFFPIALGIPAVLNWDYFFTAFHKLAFQNDYWLFNPITDPIIDVLPDAFFFHCAALILGFMLTCSLICILIGRKEKHRAKSFE